ncbi:MAG: hypothetical protein JEZ08_02300 [Clostridiales bacterium]|nr:hypothetical protein [Clostridiales bacterium]
MAKITGIGAIFLKTKKEVPTLLNWYQDVLGLDITEYGINFLIPNELTLITFDNEEGEATLNFTVDNLEVFLEELRAKDVVIHQEIEDYDYGKFAKIKDPYGKIVELWETKKENYIKMVKKEMADYKES